MNHLKTFLLTIDDDAFQLEDDSFGGPFISNKVDGSIYLDSFAILQA
jgi:hypothetical protein